MSDDGERGSSSVLSGLECTVSEVWTKYYSDVMHAYVRSYVCVYMLYIYFSLIFICFQFSFRFRNESLQKGYAMKHMSKIEFYKQI